MAEEIVEETQTEEIPETTPSEGITEGTTGNGYLTKPYLVRNLQTFWSKIKEYIKNQKFVNESYVDGALVNTASKEALTSLGNIVNGKAEQSEFKALEQLVESKADKSALDDKVNKDGDKVLSTHDFETKYKDQLDNLELATETEDGLMSCDDKQKLDDLVVNAVKTVDNALSTTSTNPVQNKIIKEELDKKVDKETLDPSEFFNQDLMLIESFTGDIVLQPRNSIKHIKLHTEKSEIIEKFYISGTNNSGETEVFNTLEGSDLEIRIPNPDGTEKPSSAVYKFYVECLEFSDSGKYKPFILRVQRDGINPITLLLEIFESQ